jgi:hypothetical protein
LVLVPDAGGHREEALADAGVDAMPGPEAVLFAGELAFQGVEDCFDPLPQAQHAAFGMGSEVLPRAGRTRCTPRWSRNASKSPPANPLSARMTCPLWTGDGQSPGGRPSPHVRRPGRAGYRRLGFVDACRVGVVTPMWSAGRLRLAPVASPERSGVAASGVGSVDRAPPAWRLGHCRGCGVSLRVSVEEILRGGPQLEGPLDGLRCFPCGSGTSRRRRFAWFGCRWRRFEFRR